MWGTDSWGAWAGHVTLPCLKWVTSEDLLEHRDPAGYRVAARGEGFWGEGVPVCARLSPLVHLKLSQQC